MKNFISFRKGLSVLSALGILGLGALACGDDDAVTPPTTPGTDAGQDTGSNTQVDSGPQNNTDSGSDAGSDSGSDAGPTASKNRLYMWAGRRPTGAAPPTGNDVVVAIDVDPTSPSYKKVVQVVDIGSGGNEPHHGGICGGKLIVGGLASGKLYTMAIAADGTLGAPTAVANVGTDVGFVDDAVCVGDKVFVTWLGSKTGQSPGAITEYKASDMSLVGQYPRAGENAPAETGTVNGLDLATVTGTNTFATVNPHGIAIDTASDTMLTTDSLVPASGGNPGGPTFRSTVRVWQFSTRKIIQTVPVCVGTVSVQFVPGSNGTQAAVACDAQATVWTMTKDAVSSKWSSKLGYTPTPAVATPFGAFLGVMAADNTAKTVYVAQSEPGLLLKVNLTDINAPVVTTATLGSGAHYVHMGKNGTIYASDYVSTAAEAAGLPASDGKVWSVNPTTMTPELLIDLHTSTDPALATYLPLNPHAVVPNE